MINRKRKLEDLEGNLDEEIVFPPKLKDLGSFSISCTIGSTTFDDGLSDLSASINVMSFSTFKYYRWN